MKIFIVDDSRNFVKGVVQSLRDAGLDANGVILAYSGETHDGKELTDKDLLALARNADVIFLDHNMPMRNGQELLEDWKSQGLDLAGKRVIGTSSDAQSYVREQIYAGDMTGPAVKKLLGIK